MLRSLDTRGGQDIIFLNFQLFFVKKCNLLKTILTKKSEHIHYRFINEFCPDEPSFAREHRKHIDLSKVAIKEEQQQL